jgi:uncharacterized membrane protein
MMKRKPILISLLALCLLVVLKVLPWEVIGANPYVGFFGKFHPAVLHVPIGVLAALFCLEVIHWIRPQLPLDSACKILLYLCLVSLIPSLGAGYLLASQGDYGSEYLEKHEDLAWWMSFVLSCLPALKSAGEAFSGGRWAYKIGLATTMVLLTLAGHHGGSLTHGSDFLTSSMPEFMKKILGQQKAPMARGEEVDSSHHNAGVSFKNEVYPLLDQYCIRCHGPNKQKGDYRIDGLSEEMLDYEDMDAWKLSLDLLLFEEMPPEGKKQPTKEEREVLLNWLVSSLKEARSRDE